MSIAQITNPAAFAVQVRKAILSLLRRRGDAGAGARGIFTQMSARPPVLMFLAALPDEGEIRHFGRSYRSPAPLRRKASSSVFPLSGVIFTDPLPPPDPAGGGVNATTIPGVPFYRARSLSLWARCIAPQALTAYWDGTKPLSWGIHGLALGNACRH